MTIKVAVFGAAGRMGATVCDAVEGAGDMELVARIDKDESLEAAAEAGAVVAVDFTVPAAVKDNIGFCLERGIHAVVGTTGLSEDDLRDIEAAASSSEANVFIAPNFALGAVLMMRFAAQAARFYEWGEVVERHHERKLDAPSGTALRTAALMRDAREGSFGRPADEHETLQGARGGDAGGVRVHSLRLPGSIAHQEVVLGAPGETLTIRHDSLDRVSFMPGVLLAIREVGSRRGLTVGLEELLGL